MENWPVRSDRNALTAEPHLALRERRGAAPADEVLCNPEILQVDDLAVLQRHAAVHAASQFVIVGGDQGR